MAFEITLPDNAPRDSGGYQILEPGWYTFAVRSCYDKTQAGEPLETQHGTPYLKVLCEDVNSGTTLHHVIFLDEEKPQRLMYFLTATGNDFDAGEGVTITTHMFHGKRFRGKVEVENGRNRITLTTPEEKKIDEKIEEEFTPEPSGPDPLDASQPCPIDPELNEDVPF